MKHFLKWTMLSTFMASAISCGPSEKDLLDKSEDAAPGQVAGLSVVAPNFLGTIKRDPEAYSNDQFQEACSDKKFGDLFFYDDAGWIGYKMLICLGDFATMDRNYFDYFLTDHAFDDGNSLALRLGLIVYEKNGVKNAGFVSLEEGTDYIKSECDSTSFGSGGIVWGGEDAINKNNENQIKGYQTEMCWDHVTLTHPDRFDIATIATYDESQEITLNQIPLEAPEKTTTK